MENKAIEIQQEDVSNELNKVNDLDTPIEAKKLKSNVRTLRNFVIACYYISCAIIFGVMGYLAVSLILSLFIPEMSVMFGKTANVFTFGFSGILGIIIYALFFGIAILPVALGFFFRNSKAEYVRILKGANKENMEIMFARLEFVAMLIKELIIDFLLLIVAVTCMFNNFIIVGILFFVALAFALLFLILVIADLIRNRVEYNKLSDEEQEAIKEKIKTFKKKKVKKEKRKRAGKLY